MFFRETCTTTFSRVSFAWIPSDLDYFLVMCADALNTCGFFCRVAFDVLASSIWACITLLLDCFIASKWSHPDPFLRVILLESHSFGNMSLLYLIVFQTHRFGPVSLASFRASSCLVFLSPSSTWAYLSFRVISSCLSYHSGPVSSFRLISCF
ncbi:hypothetical protein K435DRAFT_522942 [Dendrothele bispora CBS 962.96]|uniref:Uncharacterized protein n=1 Tax=Dendrothele bispora (strain CBS 962.96) TaxID=1314807 RepID=A0A4S8M9Z8_DENBC|nr:hypothetical protein K435DRAFT_522942 [Dendrothele bispora CBS 962.96]